MNNITITGNIISLYQYNNAVNILLADRDNPQNTVFKIALWDSDADSVMKNMEKGDEITVSGKVYAAAANRNGAYIDVRVCKLISMSKIQRTTIKPKRTDAPEEENSLMQEGE